MQATEIAMALLLGVGLSASCGLRVFVPLLVAAVAGKYGWLPLSNGFEWLQSWMAIATFGVAALVEVISYKIPYVDHLLDTIATPASVVAGTVISASFLTHIDPLTQWTLGLIIGGGAAGITQLGTVALRAGSTATTAGMANPLFALVESIGSVVASVASVFLPVVMAVVAAIVIVVVLIFMRRFTKKNMV